MNHEFTRETVMKSLLAEFPEIEVNVLEAILSVQRFSIWPNTEKFS